MPLVCRFVAYSEGWGSRVCTKTDRRSSRTEGWWWVWAAEAVLSQSVGEPWGGWSYRRVTFSSMSVLKTHFTQNRQLAALTEGLRRSFTPPHDFCCKK